MIEMGCRYAIQKIMIGYFLLCCLFCEKILCKRDVDYRDTEYSEYSENSYENLYEYENSNELPTYQIPKGM